MHYLLRGGDDHVFSDNFICIVFCCRFDLSKIRCKTGFFCIVLQAFIYGTDKLYDSFRVVFLYCKLFAFFIYYEKIRVKFILFCFCWFGIYLCMLYELFCVKRINIGNAVSGNVSDFRRSYYNESLQMKILI